MEDLGRLEKALHRRGRDAAVLEVALGFISIRQRPCELVDELVELRRRCDDHLGAARLAQRGTRFGPERLVGDADPSGPSWRTVKWCVQNPAERVLERWGALGWIDHRKAEDELAGQFEPYDRLRAVCLTLGDVHG